MNKESKLRSFLKALSWRVLATGTTFILAYTIFSNSECDDVLEKSTMVAALEAGIKLVIYYLHERAWQVGQRGSVRKLFSRNK